MFQKLKVNRETDTQNLDEKYEQTKICHFKNLALPIYLIGLLTQFPNLTELMGVYSLPINI